MDWEIPSGTVRNQAPTGGTDSDEFGTDTSGDEVNNPTDCQLDLSASTGAGNNICRALILCKGDTTWAVTGTIDVSYNYDFYTDGSIPDITAASETGLVSTLTTAGVAITTSNVVAIMKFPITIDATSSVSYQASFDDGNNWQDVTMKTLIKATNTGTTLKFKATITRTDDTKIDYIDGYACYFG